MKFKKYNSIENLYRDKFINQIHQQGLNHGTWVVQEKIHGANFSFWCNGEDVFCGKRSGLIRKTDNFYNHQIILERYNEKILDIFNLISEVSSIDGYTLKHIGVYGEIFGGNYPHPEVEKKDMKSVQKGVYYSPDVEFMAFDLRIMGLDENSDDVDFFKEVNLANEIFEKLGVPYIKTLFEGSFDECVKYNNHFQTTIPNILNYPEIENNICEGVVIRPNTTKYLYSGSRVLIKNKNEKWSEKDKQKNKQPKEIIEFTGEASKLFDEMISLVTENRLKNVISKVGAITNKDFGKLMSLMNKDVIEDFMKDFSDEFNTLEKKERKMMTKKMGQETSKLIRPNFLNIIDGEF